MKGVTAGVSTAVLVDGQSRTSPPVSFRWTVEGTRASASLSFGPYEGQVTADGVLVTTGGNSKLFPLPGKLSVPPGVEQQQQLVWRLD